MLIQEDAKWREDIKKNEGRDQFEESIASNQIIRKKKDQEEELYDILTVSLPGENIKINEAFISDFECKYKLSFIRKYKLGEVLQRVEHSGFCDYRLVRFDLEKLAEYDREGVKKFLAEQEGGHA